MAKGFFGSEDPTCSQPLYKPRGPDVLQNFSDFWQATLCIFRMCCTLCGGAQGSFGISAELWDFHSGWDTLGPNCTLPIRARFCWQADREETVSVSRYFPIWELQVDGRCVLLLLLDYKLIYFLARWWHHSCFLALTQVPLIFPHPFPSPSPLPFLPPPFPSPSIPFSSPLPSPLPSFSFGSFH